MPRDGLEAKSREMLDKTRGHQILRCCLRQRGYPTRPKQSLGVETNVVLTSRQELQTFLNLANYMSPFIPNFSALTAPLRELLMENYQFHWSPAHQKAYEKVKDSVSNEVTLTLFDPRKEIILTVDASLKSLGAILIQDNKPVALASKSLTDVETSQANIERELLATVCGCEKFHTYLAGHISPSTLSSTNNHEAPRE